MRRSVLKVRGAGGRKDGVEVEGSARERIPLDEYPGLDRLPFKMTRQLIGETAFRGQNQSSFRMAETVMREKLGIPVSDSLIEAVTYYVGGQVFGADGKDGEGLDKSLVGMDYRRDQGGVLYLMVDGSKVNTLAKDEEGSTWRENKLGIVFNSGDVRERKGKKEGEQGSRDIRRKEHVSYLGGVEGFKERLFEAAIGNGYGRYDQTVLTSDGAAWIRNMGEELFPDAVQILDLYHLAENIYSFGKYLFGGDASRYTPWAEGLIALAKESRTEELLKRLEPYKGKSVPPGVVNLYTYVKHNRDKIDYAEYKRKGYYVGSGTIESGNKVVVQRRCKQAGMRWEEENVQYMPALRAKTESGLWAPRVEPVIAPAAAA